MPRRVSTDAQSVGKSQSRTKGCAFIHHATTVSTWLEYISLRFFVQKMFCAAPRAAASPPPSFLCTLFFFRDVILHLDNSLYFLVKKAKI